MKIIDNKTELVNFKELNPGDVFKEHGDILIKIQTIRKTDTMNAVSLYDGARYEFTDNYKVQKCEAEVNVK